MANRQGRYSREDWENEQKRRRYQQAYLSESQQADTIFETPAHNTQPLLDLPPGQIYGLHPYQVAGEAPLGSDPTTFGYDQTLMDGTQPLQQRSMSFGDVSENTFNARNPPPGVEHYGVDPDWSGQQDQTGIDMDHTSAGAELPQFNGLTGSHQHMDMPLLEQPMRTRNFQQPMYRPNFEQPIGMPTFQHPTGMRYFEQPILQQRMGVPGFQQSMGMTADQQYQDALNQQQLAQVQMGMARHSMNPTNRTPNSSATSQQRMHNGNRSHSSSSPDMPSSPPADATAPARTAASQHRSAPKAPARRGQMLVTVKCFICDMHVRVPISSDQGTALCDSCTEFNDQVASSSATKSQIQNRFLSNAPAAATNNTGNNAAFTQTPQFFDSATFAGLSLTTGRAPDRDISLNIKRDDIHIFLPPFIQTKSEEIYNAFLTPHAPADPGLSVAKQQKYQNSQRKAHDECAKLMKTPEQRQDASARATLLIDEIMTVHNRGIPESYMAGGRNFKNFTIDQESKASERLAKVIDGLRKNKLIARDILQGNGLATFARAPGAYLKRKGSNFVSNNDKHVWQRKGKEMSTQSQSPASLPTSGLPAPGLNALPTMYAPPGVPGQGMFSINGNIPFAQAAPIMAPPTMAGLTLATSPSVAPSPATKLKTSKRGRSGNGETEGDFDDGEADGSPKRVRKGL